MKDRQYLTPPEILEYCIRTGINKNLNSCGNLFFLAVLGGLFIALGAAGANMATHSLPANLLGIKKFLAGAIFPVGLMMIIIGGGELFTGNNLILAAVLEKKVSLKDMLRNWTYVYAGNFAGAFLIAWLMYQSGLFSSSQGLLGQTHVNIAAEKLHLTFSQAFIRGILCNILVAIAVWMSYAAAGIGSKIAAIWFPVMLFIVGGYEHSIANMYYVPAGILAAGSTAGDMGLSWGTFVLNNLIPVTLGNIVGGSLIVGGIYWSVYRLTETYASLIVATVSTIAFSVICKQNSSESARN